MLNASRIEELKSEVGEDDFAEVVDLFCEEVEEVLGELPSVSRDALPDKLHFLKGSALNIGMEAVGALCREAEENLRSDPNAASDFAAIRATYSASKRLLLS